MNEVICCASPVRDEYSHELEKDGELCDIEDRPIGDFFGIDCLDFAQHMLGPTGDVDLPARISSPVRLVHSTDEFPLRSQKRRSR